MKIRATINNCAFGGYNIQIEVTESKKLNAFEHHRVVVFEVEVDDIVDRREENEE